MRTESSADHVITVLCVDDHPLVLEGIAQVVDLQSDMRVVASANSGEHAIEMFKRYRPDVTLMDLQLRGLSGLDAIRTIREEAPDALFVVLTMYQGDEDIFKALDAGAATYLLKDTLSHDLVRTIRSVYQGERPIPPEIRAKLKERASTPNLTLREIRIVELIAQGMRNKEIAAELRIAEETVHSHIRHIFGKLQVNDRTAALSVALKRGIIHLK